MNLMVNWICGVILAMPWVVWANGILLEQFRGPKAVLFDIFCMGIIVISLLRGLLFQYKNKFLAYLTAWIFALSAWVWFIPLCYKTEQSVLGVFNLWTVEPIIHFLLAVIATYLALSSLTRDDFYKIANALCISAVMVSIVGIFEAMGLNPFNGFIYYTNDIHVCALLDNPNLVGNYLCMSVPFFLFFRKPVYYLGLALVITAIYYTKSDLSMIATLVGIVFYIVMAAKSRRLTLLMLLLGAALICLATTAQGVAWLDLDARFAGRIEAWKLGIQHFKQSPLWGHGLGSWKTFGIMAREVYWGEAHNDWFERTMDIGLFGMALFVLLIVTSLRRVDYQSPLAVACATSFVCFLMVMFGSFPMEIAPLALTGLIGFWGIERFKK